MKAKVTLSAEEVEAIIREHLMKKCKTVGVIKIEVGKVLRGTQMQEYYDCAFKGISCEVDV